MKKIEKEYQRACRHIIRRNDPSAGYELANAYFNYQEQVRALLMWQLNGGKNEED